MQLRFKSIPKIDTKNKKLFDKIINNVDKILQIKGKGINNDTREFEEEIDRVVWLKPAVGVDCMV